MNQGSNIRSPLDGLLRCGNCGRAMNYNDDLGTRIGRYACSPKQGSVQGTCSTPALNADLTDALTINTIMETVLTDRNLFIVLANADRIALDGPPGEAEDFTLSRADIRDMHSDPDRFVKAAGGPAGFRMFLGKFVREILVQDSRAVITYNLPLPSDSPLPGQTQQEFEIPKMLTM